MPAPPTTRAERADQLERGAPFSELESRALRVLESHRDRTFTPSELARAAGAPKVSTYDAGRVLHILAAVHAVTEHERGAWTRYSAAVHFRGGRS